MNGAQKHISGDNMSIVDSYDESISNSDNDINSDSGSESISGISDDSFGDDHMIQQHQQHFPLMQGRNVQHPVSPTRVQVPVSPRRVQVPVSPRRLRSGTVLGKFNLVQGRY